MSDDSKELKNSSQETESNSENKEGTVVTSDSNTKTDLDRNSETNIEEPLNICPNDRSGKFENVPKKIVTPTKTPKASKTDIWVPVTPQMIIQALNRLRFLRNGPTLTEIIVNIKYHYPVQRNETILKNEIKKKLDLAVGVGFVHEIYHQYKVNGRIVRKGKLKRSQIMDFWLNYQGEFHENDDEPKDVTQLPKEFQAFIDSDSD